MTDEGPPQEAAKDDDDVLIEMATVIQELYDWANDLSNSLTEIRGKQMTDRDDIKKYASNWTDALILGPPAKRDEPTPEYPPHVRMKFERGPIDGRLNLVPIYWGDDGVKYIREDIVLDMVNLAERRDK